MTDDDAIDHDAKKLVFAFELDAEPEKVWRAVSVEEYRKTWLSDGAFTIEETVSTPARREVRSRLRDAAPPYFESLVTFRVAPDRAGGTILTIIHELATARRLTPGAADNDEGETLMRAA